MTRSALVMAGGTGGHIFPGLAVAEALRARAWSVTWLGGPSGSMESRLVPPRGFAYEAIDFSGLRGKGPLAFAWLPLRLLRAFAQSLQVVRRVRPDVVLGLGGYISFPGGMMGVLAGKPLVLHEQNAVPGLANRVLAQIADLRFCAFPGGLPNAQAIGNPLREAFVSQAVPDERFAGRQGPLRVLVVGGSQGARALNEVVPQALALLSDAERPLVTHQSGAAQIDDLRARYQAAGVSAELLPFIDDMASAMASADLVVARAGASTVTELAAIGAPALFVPFPQAVDDHQTRNARFLVDEKAAWLMPQAELNAQALADFLRTLDRSELLARARRAHACRRVDAVQSVVEACEALVPQAKGGQR